MRRFWRIAGSLKTGIVLLSILTIASLVGVIVPQDLGRSLYISKWGTIAGTLLLSAGLDHLFSTFWYRTVLALFSFNVLVCTSIRLRSAVFNIRTVRFRSADEIAALPLHATIIVAGEIDSVTEKTISVFKRHHIRHHLETSEGMRRLYARSGSLKEVGSAMLHFCLLPLLAGGLVATLTGYSYMQRLKPGEMEPVRDRPFFIRCDFFSLEHNKNGAVSDYKSGLTLVDSSGAVLTTKEIEVNHPLIYRGIKFYQSSYAVDPREIDSIRLVITGKSLGAIGKTVLLHSLHEQVPVGKSSVRVQAEQFVSDFIFDTKTREARSRSTRHDNPALFVTVSNDDDTLFRGWVFQRFGMMHHEDTTCGVSFMSYTRRQSTGLLIKKNPGGGLIWFGIFGMSIGVFLVFWVPRRKFWIAITQNSSDTATNVVAGCSFIKEDNNATRVWETIKTDLEA